VIVGDWRLPPLADAVIVAVPAPTAVIANDAVDPPTGMVTGVCTLRTCALLEVKDTVVALAADVESVTVPCVVLPTESVDAAIVTLEIAELSSGAVGELELEQPAMDIAATAVNTNAASGFLIMNRSAINNCARASS
jgi:hypothetical protein